jgi:hypothetical protein
MDRSLLGSTEGGTRVPQSINNQPDTTRRLMMRRILAVSAALILCAGMMSGCGKRFVGQSVDYSWEGWCQYAAYFNNGEKHCTLTSGPLIFDFDISKGENEGEYLIDGYIDPTQGELTNFSQMDAIGTSFNLIVAHAGYVVDSIGFRPQNYMGNFGQKMPFRIHLQQPNGFDAVTFAWKMRAHG